MGSLRDTTRQLRPGWLLTALLSFVILLPSLAQAQTSDALSPIRGWGSGGSGVGSTGLSGLLSGTLQVGDVHLLTVRALVSDELRLEFIDETQPLEETWAAGVLYGREITGGDRAVLTASAGLGLIGGIRRGELLRTEVESLNKPSKIGLPIWKRTDVYEHKRIRAIGLPVEVRLHTRPAKMLGVDIVAFGNANRSDTYGGIAVQVRLGPVR